jgi:hypothetical protein
MLPHKVELVGNREIPRVMEELAGRVATGKEGSRRPEGSVYLLVLGLQRFPSLKQGDEFKFSSDREGEVSPGERFADIVRDGPAQGVHTVVWCDTLNNLNRALSRKSLREFDQRVLFQMSPADSSELVDSTAGGSLGLHNALLAIQSEGLVEKFRPYAIPDAECLERIRSCFAARFPRAENGG